jgi:hypothetical protein
MRHVPWVVVVVVGCGRVRFEPATDARTIDGPLGPFSAPTLISVLSDPVAYDGDPSLTADLLEIYFKSDRGPNQDIYHATRASPSDPWPPPTRDPELSSAMDDVAAKVAPDGLTIFLTRRPVPEDIYVATRASRTSPWSSVVAIAELDTAAADGSLGTADPGTLVAYFDSNRDAADGMIYRTTRTSVATAWSTPVAVSELSQAGGPWSSPDDLDIVFSSNRAGGAGTPPDLYVAHRPSALAPFDPPISLVELNTPGSDADPWWSPDLRYIIFNRDGDLYEAWR